MKSKDPETKKNCIVCALSPCFFVATIIGLFPFKFCCPHSNPPTPCTIKVTLIRFVYTFALLGYRCLALIINVMDLFDPIATKSKINVTYVCLDAMVLSESVAMYIMGLFRISYFKTMLSRLNSVLDRSKQYGFESLFNQSSYHGAKKNTTLFAITLTIIFIFPNIYVVSTWQNNAKYGERFLIRTTGLILTVYQIQIYCLTLAMFTYFYLKLFEEMSEKIITILEPYRKSVWNTEDIAKNHVWNMLEYKENTFKRSESEIETVKQTQTSSVTDKLDPPLALQLCRIRKFYAILVANVKQMSESFDPNKLFALICSVVTLIACICYVIYGWISDFKHDNLTILLINTAGNLIIMYTMLNMSDQLHNMSKEIASNLYLYPISGLDPGDSAEVALLLTMLREQQPLLTFSGIFNVSSSIVASITGSAITYILVIFQFGSNNAKMADEDLIKND